MKEDVQKVYKYRSGGITFDRDINALEKNYFYASNAKKLNDPCETLVFIDEYEKQMELVTKLFKPNFKETNINTGKSLENFVNIKNEFGIYSLSKVFDDELLWAHYASNHEGFCIEYEFQMLKDTESIYDFHCFDVNYKDVPPQIDLNDLMKSNLIELIIKLAGTKSKRWFYENEVRIITDKFGKQYYDFRVVKSIYFGLNMEKKKKEKIMKILSGRNMQYYQMELEPKSYRFKRKPIIDLFKDSKRYMFIFYRSKNSKHYPKEINFEIIEKRLLKSNNKGDLSIRLHNRLTLKELTELGRDLKEKLFTNLGIVYINYYLLEMNLDAAWAITHFSEQRNDFQIIGIDTQKEKEFLEIIKNEKRDIIGQWIDESPYGGGLLILFKENGKIFFEQIYKDNSKSIKEQKMMKSSKGIRFEDVESSGSGEYTIVNKSGTLKYFDPDGLLFTITKNYKKG